MPNSDWCVITSWPAAWRELASITVPTMEGYCRSRGYDFLCDESDTGRSYFTKLDLVIEALPRYKYVVWVDCDMLFLSDYLDLDAMVEDDDPHFIQPFDWNGINATFMVFKNDPIVKQWLHAVRTMGYQKFVEFSRNAWAETDALDYFANRLPYSEDLITIGYSVKLLCPILAESAYDVPDDVRGPYLYEKGDSTLHLSALSLPRRIHLAKQFVERDCVLDFTSSASGNAP